MATFGYAIRISDNLDDFSKPGPDFPLQQQLLLRGTDSANLKKSNWQADASRSWEKQHLEHPPRSRPVESLYRFYAVISSLAVTPELMYLHHARNIHIVL